MQTPRVGYDMPGQGKAAMADSNLYPWPPPLPLPLPLTLTLALHLYDPAATRRYALEG